MAVRVVLTNRSQETGNLSKIGTDGSVRVNRIVYQGLRSLAKNKTISADYTAGLIPRELVELYEEFSKINDGDSSNTEMVKLSEYLGLLGIEQEYEYKKDRIGVAPWIEYTDQLSTRNVVAGNLTPPDNVIDRATGYNVIHNTEE